MNRYLIVTHYDDDEIKTSITNDDYETEIEIRAYAKETYKRKIKTIFILDLHYNSVIISIETYGYFGSIDKLPKTQKFLHSKEFQNYWTKNNSYRRKWEDFTTIPLVDKKREGETY